MSEKDPHRYDDIIDLPHFVSKDRRHMSNYDRAAQFAPFDAISIIYDMCSLSEKISYLESILLSFIYLSFGINIPDNLYSI